MSILCHAEVDGDRLDQQELIDESLLILIGGDETTRHVISGGAYQLLVDRTGGSGCAPTARSCPPRSRRCCGGSPRSRT
ncbi:MAG: hypothetical protein U0P45_01000 [Acidimicrobiales bacterium]